MDDFNHSVDAENILHLFYQADVMVYVEGPDDICFWEIVFSKISSINVEVQDVGGCEELSKLITRATNNSLDIIIACDSDFTNILNSDITDSRVIKTPGHSIENTFINQYSVYNSIKTLGKISQKGMNGIDIQSWRDDFYEKLEPLIKLDIYNSINQRGVAVIGSSADRFMESRNSHVISREKIDSYLQSKLTEADINSPTEIDVFFHDKDIEYSRWLRGHFLFSAVHRLVSVIVEMHGKRISLSQESLYSSLITSFNNNFNEQHRDYRYFQEKISAISI
ncbi:DUF4435 domain-containing protein [Edwardsiella tarda]